MRKNRVKNTKMDPVRVGCMSTIKGGAYAFLGGTVAAALFTTAACVSPDAIGTSENSTSLGVNKIDDRVTLTKNSTVYNSLVRVFNSGGASCSATLVDLNTKELGLKGKFVVLSGHCVAQDGGEELHDGFTMDFKGYDHRNQRPVSASWTVSREQVVLHPNYTDDVRDPNFSDFDIAVIRVADNGEVFALPDWSVVQPVDFNFMARGHDIQDSKVNTFGFPWDYNSVAQRDKHDVKEAVAHYGCYADRDFGQSVTLQCDLGSGQSGGAVDRVVDGRSVLVAVNSMVNGGDQYLRSLDPNGRYVQMKATKIRALLDPEMKDKLTRHFASTAFAIEGSPVNLVAEGEAPIEIDNTLLDHILNDMGSKDPYVAPQ